MWAKLFSLNPKGENIMAPRKACRVAWPPRMLPLSQGHELALGGGVIADILGPPTHFDLLPLTCCSSRVVYKVLASVPELRNIAWEYYKSYWWCHWQPGFMGSTVLPALFWGSQDLCPGPHALCPLPMSLFYPCTSPQGRKPWGLSTRGSHAPFKSPWNWDPETPYINNPQPTARMSHAFLYTILSFHLTYAYLFYFLNKHYIFNQF